MKKIIQLSISIIILTYASKAQNTNDSMNLKSVTQTVKIKTSSVCETCKATLEKSMAFEKGVKEATLDIPSKILTVTYDSRKTTPEKIRIAVSKTGYDADDIPADKKAYENLEACCKKENAKK